MNITNAALTRIHVGVGGVHFRSPPSTLVGPVSGPGQAGSHRFNPGPGRRQPPTIAG
jgi:hypothetical protein